MSLYPLAVLKPFSAMTKEEADARKGLVSSELLLPEQELRDAISECKPSAHQIGVRTGTNNFTTNFVRLGYPAPVRHFMKVLRFLGFVIVKPDKAYLANLAEDLGYSIIKK